MGEEGRYKNGGCKRCVKDSAKIWNRVNKERRKEIIHKYDKKRNEKIKNNPVLREKRNKYQSKLSANKKKDPNFLDKIRKYKNNYNKNRRKEDLQFRLQHVLRSRLSKAIKSKSKSISAVRDLGCSIQDLRLYLESLFRDDMSWDNYGEWHIDHIVPLSHFQLSSREQLLKACHYTNLQPLWAKENLSKRNNLK